MLKLMFLLDIKSYKLVSSGFDLGSIAFSYMNDLPKITGKDAEVVLNADVTSIIVTNSNQGGLQTALNKTLSDTISFFKANFLLLHFNIIMYYSEFRTKNCIGATLDINCFNKSIANVTYTNFMGLMIDDTPTWVDHIDQLISRLNFTYYTIRAVRARFTRKALRMLYFPYVDSIISNGIIFLVTPVMVLKYSE
jgi:hypothetical protein